MSTINGSRLKILAMLFLFVPQESWDLQLRMFGYITCGFPRIFGYVLQVIKYSISVPLDRGGFGGWNLMLTKNHEIFVYNTLLLAILYSLWGCCFGVGGATILVYELYGANAQNTYRRVHKSYCLWPIHTKRCY